MRSPFRTRLRQLRILVIDEADMLLDTEESVGLQTVLRRLPPKELRQTILASATFPLSEMEVIVQQVCAFSPLALRSWCFLTFVGSICWLIVV